MNSVTVTDTPEAFVSLLKSGITQIVEAARMLQRLVKENPNAIADIRKIDPTIAPSVFTKLLLVAEGRLMPALLFNEAPMFKRMQALPRTTQEDLLNQGYVEVVTNTDDVLRVQLADVEIHHLPQLFRPHAHTLRDPDEQRAFIRRNAHMAREVISSVTVSDFPWVIRGNKVVFPPRKEEVILSKRDLQGILKQLK